VFEARGYRAVVTDLRTSGSRGTIVAEQGYRLGLDA
jgi:hypothetical protein